MSASATAVVPDSVQGRTFDALLQLAVAYLDRMAANDWVRAGIVLSTFASTYNQHRADVVARFQALAPGVVSHLPATLGAFFDSAGGANPNTAPVWRMREVLALMLLSAVPTGADPQHTFAQGVETMPVVAISLGGWWNLWRGNTATTVGSSAFNLSNTVGATEVAQLGQFPPTVEAYIASGAPLGSHPAAPQPAAPAIPGASATPSTPLSQVAHMQSTPIQLPPQTITGTVPRFVMPTWGWWAIGVGGVAAAGVLAYGILEQGWFDPKSRRRRRR